MSKTPKHMRPKNPLARFRRKTPEATARGRLDETIARQQGRSKDLGHNPGGAEQMGDDEK